MQLRNFPRRWAPAVSVLLALVSAPLAAQDATAKEGAAKPGAGDAATLQLSVQVHGLRNDRGRVAVAVFNDPDAFPDQEQALVGKLAPINKRSSRVVFNGLRPGVYAIAVLHDENKNDKMDFSFLGMPQEGFGFSRDAAVVLGPPSFKAAAMKLRAKHSLIKVKARYFSL